MTRTRNNVKINTDVLHPRSLKPLPTRIAMKLSHQLIIVAALLTLPACEQKPANPNGKDGVKDALDRRPGEEVRDVAEDAGDAVKDASKDIKDAIKD
jgi:hypothetical protein